MKIQLTEKELERYNIWKIVSSHLQEQIPRYHAFSITRLTNNCKVDSTGQACGKAGAFLHCLAPHVTAPGRALCYSVSKSQRLWSAPPPQHFCPRGQIALLHQECQQKRQQQWQEEKKYSPVLHWDICSVFQMRERHV